MLNIVLFGPPGAGKGTQSKKLIDKYKLIHLSTGDILRGEIEEKTNLGLKAKELMDKGVLVPDEIVISMIENKLNQNNANRGFIFDGFPRTIEQAEALDKLLSLKNAEISIMISLKVNQEELENRLLLRGKESERTDDLNIEIIRNRIWEYINKTSPLSEYYKNQNKLTEINGSGKEEDIFKDICKSIEKHQKIS